MNRHRPGRVARTLLRAPARLYDWRCGWLLGHRFLRLTHVGRNSGRRYQTMLEVIGTGRAVNEFLVVAGLGRAADWYRNLRAAPAVEVAIGRSRFRPVHRILNVEEAVAALTDYEHRNRSGMRCQARDRATTPAGAWPSRSGTASGTTAGSPYVGFCCS